MLVVLGIPYDEFAINPTLYYQRVLIRLRLITILGMAASLVLPLIQYLTISVYKLPVARGFVLFQCIVLVSYAILWARHALSQWTHKDRRRAILRMARWDIILITLFGAASLNPFSELHLGYVVALGAVVVIEKSFMMMRTTLLIILGPLVMMGATYTALRIFPEIAALSLPIRADGPEWKIEPETPLTLENIEILRAELDHRFAALFLKQTLPRMGFWAAAGAALFLGSLFRRRYEDRSRLYQEQNRLLRTVIDHVGIAIFYKHVQKRKDHLEFCFQLANAQLQRQLGKTEVEMLGETDERLGMMHHAEYKKSDMEAYARGQSDPTATVSKTEPSYSLDVKMVTTEKYPIVVDGQGVVGIVGMCELADARLRANLLHAALQDLPFPVFLKERSGVIIAANRAFWMDAGRKENEKEANTWKDIDLYDLDLAHLYQAFDLKLWMAYDLDPTYLGEVETIPTPEQHGKRNGPRRLVWVSKCLIRHGGNVYLLGIFRDLTPKERQEHSAVLAVAIESPQPGDAILLKPMPAPATPFVETDPSGKEKKSNTGPLTNHPMPQPVDRSGLRTDPVRVFIVHSHKDTEALHMFLRFFVTADPNLRRQLQPREFGNEQGDSSWPSKGNSSGTGNILLDIWWDKQIAVGQDWNVEIRGKFYDAEIILLFVTQDFFTSDYISRYELPGAEERHMKWKNRKGKRVEIAPLLIKTSTWNEASWRRSLQTLSDTTPILSDCKLGSPEAENRFHNASSKLLELARSLRKAP